MQNNLYDSVTYYNGVPRYAWNSQAAVAQSTVSGWMGSSGHRENILSSAYDREGIGIAIAKDDKVYISIGVKKGYNHISAINFLAFNGRPLAPALPPLGLMAHAIHLNYRYT